MKLGKLYEEAMEKVYMDFDYDEDGIEITALQDRKVIGLLKLKFIDDAWSEMSDLVEMGNLTYQEYKKIFPRDKYAEIESITVNEDERGQGVAKILMNNAISTAKKEGETVLYLNASPIGNTGLDLGKLVNLYKSFGFQTLVDDEQNVEMFLNI